MKLVEITEMYNEDGEASRVTVEIENDKGEKESLSFGEGEPEDMYLFRDLSDAYSIVNFAKMCFQAGKDGEELTIESIEEKD